MNEESDGINENENNNSEVVILPERSHVDELLLSDQSEIREDSSDYERKLDEKLKDLGLLEDDMTINQKEELLAVVVISCETAEQEENKRQLIKEYLEGAQSLQDEIEFSLQESAWLADEANLLCLSTGSSKDDTTVKNKMSSSFMDCEASTSSKEFEGFESLAQVEGTSFKSSPVIFDYATASSELFLQSSSTSENDSKKQVLGKGQSDRSRKLNQCISDANVKVAVTHPILHSQITKKSKAEQLLDTQLSIQVENLFLDKTMSSWKPCMSPKDKPLSGFRSKRQKRENVTSFSAQDKVNKYLTSFGKCASSLKKKRSSSSKLIQLNKPYVVLNHGSLARKACKLDNYDFIIGVTDRVQPAETEENFMPCNTLTRAKSAFHRVKPSVHGRFVSFSGENTSSKTTRSGATYSSQKSFKEKMESSPEIILDDCFNEADDASDDFVLKAITSEKRVTFQDDVIKHDSSKKLPKFGDLRPEIHKSSSMIVPIIKKESPQSIKSNCSLHNNTKKIPLKEEKLGNASERDYSSDSSSSLIDVETIVDDEVAMLICPKDGQERISRVRKNFKIPLCGISKGVYFECNSHIEEFVMKRKLTSSTHKTNYAKSPCHSKKLKKNEP